MFDVGYDVVLVYIYVFYEEGDWVLGVVFDVWWYCLLVVLDVDLCVCGMLLVLCVGDSLLIL